MSVYSKDKFVTLLTYGYVVTGIQKMQGISVQLTAGSVSERLKMDLGEKYKKDKCEVITVCEDKSFRNEKKTTFIHNSVRWSTSFHPITHGYEFQFSNVKF